MESKDPLSRYEWAAAAYFGPDLEARQNAWKYLSPLTFGPSAFTECKWIFENARRASFPCLYSMTFAGRALVKLIERYIERKEGVKDPAALRNWLIEQILTERKNGELPKAVRGALMEAVGRMVKIGFPKLYSMQTSHKLVRTFVESQNNQKGERIKCLVASILGEIVDAMSRPYKEERFGDHRLRSKGFQNAILKDILNFAFEKIGNSSLPVVEVLLDLIHRCLSFNFFTGPDHRLSTDDNAHDFLQTVAYPHTWLGAFETPMWKRRTLDLYEIAQTNNRSFAIKALRILQLIASVDRKVFTSEENFGRHLLHLVEGLQAVPLKFITLWESSPGMFHDFSLLIVRLITYCDVYHCPLERVQGLLEMGLRETERALKGGKDSLYASQYLIELWANLALEGKHLGITESLDKKDPSVPRALGKIFTRTTSTLVEAIISFIRDGAQRGEAGAVLQSGDIRHFLDHIPALARYSFEKSMGWLLDRLKASCVSWKRYLEEGKDMKSMIVNLSDITALVAVTSSIISGPHILPLSTSVPKENLIIDAKACIIIMEIMAATTRRIKLKLEKPPHDGDPEIQVLKSLDIALIGFIDSFTIHCSTTSARSIRNHRDLLVTAGLGKLVPTFDEEGFDDLDFLISMKQDEWNTLQDTLNLSKMELKRLDFEIKKQRSTREGRRGNTAITTWGKDPVIFPILSQLCNRPMNQEDIISGFFCKVIESLTFWGNDQEAVQTCITLLNSLVTGTATERTVRQAKITPALLSRQAGGFQFFDRLPDPKLRTQFYSILGRLLFCDRNRKHFPAFMKQFSAEIETLAKEMSRPSVRLKNRAICICRDLTGLLDIVEARKDYIAIFNWFFPQRFRILLRILETWWSEGSVVNPLLKLVSHLVDNKHQRISFPPVSANGLKLFKEVVKIINVYCTRFKKLMEEEERLKDHTIKGLDLCLRILTRALSGNYVAFEVFDMYRDECYTHVISSLLGVSLQLKSDILMQRPKVFRHVCAFISELACSHMSPLCMQEAEVISKVLSLLLDGVCFEYDPITPSACAGALENIFEFYYQHKNDPPQSRTGQQAARLRILLSDQKCKVSRERVVPVLFSMSLFGDGSAKILSLSRPLLCAIACDEKGFVDFKLRFISSQRPDDQKRLEIAFEGLMRDIGNKITYKEKNFFARNLYEVAELVRTLPNVSPLMF
mmetsp:Transcript_26405/g.41809  ORF Transcript_26405/g.41809 Transcript_26405/m.41809 type:complete len:1185 (-) Transcript_26405:131-3685(-)